MAIGINAITSLHILVFLRGGKLKSKIKAHDLLRQMSNSMCVLLLIKNYNTNNNTVMTANMMQIYDILQKSFKSSEFQN